MTTEFQVKIDRGANEILTVSQLNKAVSRLFDESLAPGWVQGEISNFTSAASGHWYFTLKDESASVKAVMFRGRALTTGFLPRPGDRVEVRARVTLYEARGEYQLQVEQMRRSGLGSLYEAFLALKSRLAAEGLFDSASKREIARFPRAVGVITSLSAAALRDVLTAMARRAPHIPVIVYPAQVQGAQAPLQLRQALALANERQEVDTLLLVRGGGSIEDLWAFNDESLARDIAASLIPVVCGVGHETDFTIADFVADLRAPTPTAAAELVCATRAELLERAERAARALSTLQQRRLERLAQRVDRAATGVIAPDQRLAHQSERVRSWAFRLTGAMRKALQSAQSRHASLQGRFAGQLPDVSAYRYRVERAATAVSVTHAHALARRRQQVAQAESQLRALSPENTLARGYAIARLADGQVVRDAATLRTGEVLTVTLARGEVDAAVTQSRVPSP
jgi:exodeoxyribonuclease VII large subunit